MCYYFGHYLALWAIFTGQDFDSCCDYCIFVDQVTLFLDVEKLINIPYEHYADIAQMSDADRKLIEAARNATEQAYAPFSNFKVGAAARLESGRIIVGANRESEVFPSGLCAERALLFMHQSNYANDKIEAMAIASNPAPRECYPCGACRQTLLDVESRQKSPIRVIMAGAESATVVEKAELLLPFTFKL